MLEDLYLPAPPLPTTTNGAQTDGCQAGIQLAGRDVSAIAASMARRTASARPMASSAASAAMAVVTSFTAAALSTSQCETSSARAPA